MAIEVRVVLESHEPGDAVIVYRSRRASTQCHNMEWHVLTKSCVHVYK